MPWLTILLALLSYFTTKKAGGSETAAILAGTAVGVGTYYTTHNTDWGKANLGALDGVIVPGSGTLKDSNGDPIIDPGTGLPIPTGSKGLGDVLTSWGASGTAAVIGTTAVATSGNKTLLFVGIIAAVLILTGG